MPDPQGQLEREWLERREFSGCHDRLPWVVIQWGVPGNTLPVSASACQIYGRRPRSFRGASGTRSSCLDNCCPGSYITLPRGSLMNDIYDPKSLDGQTSLAPLVGQVRMAVLKGVDQEFLLDKDL